MKSVLVYSVNDDDDKMEMKGGWGKEREGDLKVEKGKWHLNEKLNNCWMVLTSNNDNICYLPFTYTSTMAIFLHVSFFKKHEKDAFCRLILLVHIHCYCCSSSSHITKFLIFLSCCYSFFLLLSFLSP
jgi:hypothetical protein